jgi:hypothetical protein
MPDPTIFTTIDQVISSLPLSASRVGTVLGVRLWRDHAGETAAFQAHRQPASVKDGPFSSVELRMPDGDIGDGQALLSITLRDAQGVDQSAINDRFGTDFQTEIPPPRFEPGSVPVYLIYRMEWGILSFGVTADARRMLVSIVFSASAASGEQSTSA